MDVFWSWPPVIRTLTVATLATSVLAHSGMISFMPLVFIPQRIFQMPPKIPQIWRFITPFLLTGPKFSILMDPYFLFTYGSALEKDSPRFSELGSFFTYVVFVMAFVTGTCGFYLGGYTFLQPLILAFAYTFSQDNPNTNVSIYILTFPAKYLPFGLLAMTFVMDGPPAALSQATGLIAAHFYDFLTRIWPTFGGGRNYIQTPAMVKRLFADGTRPIQNRSFGTAFGRREEPSRPDNWSGQRGPGRRLGGE